MAKSFTKNSFSINALKYVDSNLKGFSRKKYGKGFSFFDDKNKKITNQKIIARINDLVIPPNWKKVWICPYDNGHIQATGLDDRKRKQYIYHHRWIEHQNTNKYIHLYEFGKGLPTLKKRINKDLNKKQIDVNFIAALAIKIILKTSIRPGNEVYKKSNGSYGLTTLQNKHVHLKNGTITFKFVGKKAVKQEKQIKDKALFNLIKKVKAIPGSRFLQFYDDNRKIRQISPAILNSYLQNIYPINTTNKTIRTWNACYLSLEFLLNNYQANQKRNKTSKELVEFVASNLGNTVAVAKKNYIAPRIIEEFENEKLDSWLMRNKNLKNRKSIIQTKLLEILK